MKRLFFHLLILLTYAGIIVWDRWEMFALIKTDYFGGNRGDGGLYVYIVKEVIARTLTWPSAGFDIWFFYPFTRGLAYTDNFLLPAAIAKLLLLKTNNIILSYNLTHALAYVLNGYVMFLLVNYLTKNKLVSLLGGYAFMVLPYFYAHISHAQLQWAFFIPATLLAILCFVETNKKRYASAIGVMTVGSFLCSVYYALFGILLTVLAFVALLLQRRFKITKNSVLALHVANIPWIVALGFLALPYLDVKEAFGERGLFSIKHLSSTSLSLLAAPIGNTTWGPLTHSLSHFEARLFPGAVLLLLALACFFLPVAGKKNRVLYWLKIIGMLGFLSGVFAEFYFFFVEKNSLRIYFRTIPYWITIG